MKKIKYYIIAVLFAISIGLSPLVIKLIYTQVSSITILAHRFLIALILLTIMVKEKPSITILKQLLPLSLLFPIGMFLFQILALENGTTIEVTIVQACLPILSLIGAIVFHKQKVDKIKILFVLLSMFGILLILFQKGKIRFSLGIVYALLSIVAWAIYTIKVKSYLNKFDTETISYSIIMHATIILNTYALITQKDYFIALQNTHYLLGVNFLGVCSTAFSIIAMVYMIQNIGVFQASIFTNLATVITILAGIFVLKESATIIHYIGIVMVLIGVIGSNRSKV